MSHTTKTQAYDRIAKLLDTGSFVELGAGITARATDFNPNAPMPEGDGVITGYGQIDGDLVYLFSQDASVLGGSIGEMHAKKILSIYDLAVKTGAPVIGLIDCAGLRLEEATDSLDAFGKLFRRQVLASGIIPRICAIFGQCGGGLAILPALSDFAFMAEDASLFVNAPNALAGARHETTDTSSAAFQAKHTGIVDFTGDEQTVLHEIRSLISMLPSNYRDYRYDPCQDDLNRICPDIVQAAFHAPTLLRELADDHIFVEKAPDFAPEMTTGLLKLNGMTIGAVANSAVIAGSDSDPAVCEALLTADGCRKAAEFITFCDAFNIPVLTVTNTGGFLAEIPNEKQIARAAASLVHALAGATVPKVNLITKQAYSSAYVVMNSKGLGCDFAMAWPQANIGMMDAAMAAKIMYADTGVDLSAEAAAYKALQNNVASAAARGYIDLIIEPEQTRKHLINSFEMLFTKKEQIPEKKHGSIL